MILALEDIPEMPWHQRVAIVVAAGLLMYIIFQLVKKRRLREEYSWLWLLTGASVLALAFVPQKGLVAMARIFGSENPPAAIFFLGFCFIALLCLQFSVRLSRMTEHVKTLAQKIALLEADLEKDQKL
ncbi:DUF2304 domain-containing protein [bacterium]|nr:DUF2304 domain-containing protein [bacterium]